MKEKVTIQDIANELNLSLATVSRVFSGQQNVSEKTKKKVIDLANKYGYRPNSIASSLRRGKTKTIGIVIPRTNRDFFSNLIYSIENVLTEAGYTTIICQTIEKLEKEKNNILTLMNSNVSGIIISHSKETKNGKHIQQAIDKGIDVLQFDRVLPDLDTSAVTNDNFGGAKQATLQLIEQGYTKIAYFNGVENSNVFQERYQGYLKAHEEKGITPDLSLVFQDTITREEGVKAARLIIDQKLKCDAIFSSSDYSALGAYLTFKEQGIQIPEQMGIYGFANEPFTELTTPSISSCDQNSQEIGRLAAEQIIREIENKETTKIKITVPVNQNVRQSTIRKL